MFANIHGDVKRMVTVVSELRGNDSLEVPPWLYTIFSNMFYLYLIPCRDTFFCSDARSFPQHLSVIEYPLDIVHRFPDPGKLSSIPPF